MIFMVYNTCIAERHFLKGLYLDSCKLSVELQWCHMSALQRTFASVHVWRSQKRERSHLPLWSSGPGLDYPALLS